MLIMTNKQAVSVVPLTILYQVIHFLENQYSFVYRIIYTLKKSSNSNNLDLVHFQFRFKHFEGRAPVSFIEVSQTLSKLAKTW